MLSKEETVKNDHCEWNPETGRPASMNTHIVYWIDEDGDRVCHGMPATEIEAQEEADQRIDEGLDPWIENIADLEKRKAERAEQVRRERAMAFAGVIEERKAGWRS